MNDQVQYKKFKPNFDIPINKGIPLAKTLYYGIDLLYSIILIF